MARRTIFFFLLISILVLAGCGEKEQQLRMRSIGMAGGADTLVVPDLAVWTVRINDLDPLLVGAKDSNDARLAAVLGALEKIRLVEGSVRTGPARIERQFRRCDDGVNRFSHFSVKRSVTFRQDDPDEVEKALDVLVSAADIEVSCYFDLADTEAIMKQLRTRAMDQAKDKAAFLARHVGMSLGEILSIRVNENLNAYQHNRRMAELNGGVASPQAQHLSTQVSVSYKTF